ncbi:MAG: PD-(D/E)XK nuclease family protein, partial [Gammaproteobacteria bacterium]
PAQALFASGRVEHFEDADGEPWRDAAPLPSGSRSVEHQIRCAFRAYAQLRLGAEPLERPRPGLDPRERGRLVHHALDLLWREVRDSGRLAAKRGAALNRLIERVVERAAAHLLAEEPGAERERALRRERRRVARLLASLCELEAKRTPFTVIEHERRLPLEIEGARLNVRVDRIDRLDDGRLALIDYKTGEPQKQDWLGDRPTHPQLLVYLLGATGEVAALANAHLATGRVAFRGVADRAGRLPKLDGLAPSDDASDAWRRQVDSWREIVERAVRDFVAGRALRDPAEGACRFCHLHAFCRIGDAAVPGAHDE